MDYKKSYAVAGIGMLAGVLLLLCAWAFGDFDGLSGWLLLVGGVITGLFGIVQAAVYYRCPCCGRQLSIRTPMPRFCPECGERLRDGEG